jgi:hypothetical protein
VAHDDPQRWAAELLAGELSAAEAERLRHRIDADPEARAALACTEAAVAALRAWRQQFDALPPPPLPRPRRRRPVALAAAALLAVAAGLAWLHPRFGPVPVARPGWQARELEWAFGDRESPRPSARLEIDLAAGQGGPGGIGKGGPPDAAPVLRDFAWQFAFAFRVPAQLPGGFVLERGRPRSPRAVRLTYTAGDRTLDVWLQASPGPDKPPRALAAPRRSGPPLLAARRRGVAVAAAGVDRAAFADLISLFLPESVKESQ